MSSVKIFMLANAFVDGMQYVSGDEYEVDTNTYRSIGTSCCLSSKKPRYARRIKQRMGKTLNVIDSKILIEPKTFLVIKTQGIGNVIAITPAIQKIHELFPKCKIDFMCDDTKVKMLKGWKLLNKVYEYPNDVDTVMGHTYDVALVGVPGHGDDKLFESFRARQTLKPNQRALMIQHEVIVNMQPLEHIGWNGVNVHDTYIHITGRQRTKIKKAFPGKKYIGICAGFFPSEQWSRKNWGYENYARLIKLIKKEYKGHKIVLIGTGPDDKPLEYLRSKRGIINAVGEYSINETAAILERCKFLVTNDTGCSHVAGAVGCKVYTIFGPTSITKNHPWRNSQVITLGLECSPCQYTQRWASCDKWECLDIRPEEVLDCIKPEPKKRIKHELGVIMANHNRYDLALACLHSLLQCEGVNDVRFILINDNSDPRTSALLERFAKAQGNTHVIYHEDTHGRELYHVTINRGLEAASDCRYIMFMPDDGIYNSHLFDVVKKSYKHLNNQIKCVTYWKDGRPSGRGKEIECEYDKHFEIAKYMDGFMILFEREYLDNIEIHGRTSPGGSSIWWNIQLQMQSQGHKILRLKETLAEHIGNLTSSMHPEGRKKMPIHADSLNIWRKPKILRGK